MMNDSIELRGERRDKNWKAIGIAAATTIICAIIGIVFTGWAGVLAGLVVGLIVTLAGPPAVTKIMETERRVIT